MSIPFRILEDVYDATTETILEAQVLFDADTVLDSIFPSLLPLCLTLLVYYLYSKKKWSPMKLMLLILVMALVLTGIGYATGYYA